MEEIYDIQQSVIISDSLLNLSADCKKGYLAHALFLGGECYFRYNEKEYVARHNDVVIMRQGWLVEDIRPSDDYRIKVIYIHRSFVEQCTPLTNYGMRGSIALFLNPLMHLTDKQAKLCENVIRMVEYRLNNTDHHFYREMMRNAVQHLILDFFDFHSHLYGELRIFSIHAETVAHFLRLLDEGNYRQNREVTWYANRLCVTSKYLSEASKRVTGYPANYWINRYTTLDISHQLRNPGLSFTQIADTFGFSSPAYFNRYVLQHLGMTPSAYRK